VSQAEALAPDAGALKAARTLAIPEPWSATGCNGRAVWGTCRGSAKLPYQVVCDSVGPAYRCTCPSRKFPCKHALALLLLWADQSPVVTEGNPPADAAAWLAGRSATESTGTIADAVGAEHTAAGVAAEHTAAGVAAEHTAAADGAEPPGPRRPRVRDPVAAAARAEQRTERIIAGMGELDRWLGDLIRHGFGHAQSQPYGYWDDMAARLVDAQAPAAAARVRRLAGVVRSGSGWPARLLSQVARLHLLAAGWARYDSLPKSTQADLRTAAGWPWPSDQVLPGDKETDRWYVLARSVTEEEQVRAQRTWLWGLGTGRLAVLVDFARPGAAFAWELWPGNVLDADVARYPGSAPLRVLVAARRGDPGPGGQPPGWDSLSDAAAARSTAVSADPWIDRWPLSVIDVIPGRRPDGWQVTDRDGRSLNLMAEGTVGWNLLALSGGRPLQLLGEWEEGGITPLAVWAENRMVVL
jgi:SWIM zinc finger